MPLNHEDKFIGHNLEKIGSKNIRAKEEIVILKPLKCMLDELTHKSPQTGKFSH